MVLTPYSFDFGRELMPIFEGDEATLADKCLRKVLTTVGYEVVVSGQLRLDEGHIVLSNYTLSSLEMGLPTMSQRMLILNDADLVRDFRQLFDEELSKRGAEERANRLTRWQRLVDNDESV